MTRDYTFLTILKNGEVLEFDMQRFASSMENAVNSFGFPKEKVCELLFNDEHSINHFLDISLAWIQNLAGREKWQYDDRNELSVKLAKGLMSGVEIAYQPLSSTKTFVKEAERWHRTLQQTFSGLVFCFLGTIEVPEDFIIISKNIDEMKKKYGEKWYGLPMI